MITYENDVYLWHFRLVSMGNREIVDIQVSAKDYSMQRSRWFRIQDDQIVWTADADSLLLLIPEAKQCIQKMVKMRTFI